MAGIAARLVRDRFGGFDRPAWPKVEAVEIPGSFRRRRVLDLGLHAHDVGLEMSAVVDGGVTLRGPGLHHENRLVRPAASLEKRSVGLGVDEDVVEELWPTLRLRGKGSV